MEILFDWDLHRVEAGLLFIIFYVLFIYIFILFSFYLFIYFFCLYTERVPVRGVSIYILVFLSLFIYLFIYLGAPWGCSFLVQLHVDGMQLYQQ